MEHFSSNGTLKVTKPVGNILVLAIFFVLLLVLILEGSSRLAISARLLEEPGIGTGNADLNIKIPLLDNLVTKTGGVDCIFLGSSMTNYDVDPEVFAQTYTELSGRKVTCFNFAIATLTGEIAGGLSRILVERYHPGLLIFGTSARDYSSELGARALKDDPWYLYKMGEWNMAGWLQDNSMLYREFIKLLSDLQPGNREYAIIIKQNTSPFGHFIVDTNNTSLEGQNVIHEKILLQKDFAGVKRLIKLDGTDVRVVVIEIPVHEKFLPIYVNDKTEEYYSLFFDPLAELLNKKGIQFINTITGGRFSGSEDGWSDMKHLNNKGSAKFSAWLAGEIWRLEQTNQLTWRVE
jgi:hypothetical protein